jgi:2-phospho-L-lactate transferase/gluconeogenesis factor (CofD/UPF0052 family)
VKKIRVSLFCGGRGSAALIRELSRRPDIKLNLLINAYDDGLSTGEIRGFIPGMLGPSDFRKNLSYLLDLHSNEQYALTSLLEYRFPVPTDAQAIVELSKALKNPTRIGGIEAKLNQMLQQVDPSTLKRIHEYVLVFMDYCDRQPKAFDFSDCSLGNILFAGAYIKAAGNFNQATAELATLFGSKASLINVTGGENRILVALKEDGEILECEAKIVGPQSASRITDLFLVDRKLTTHTQLLGEGRWAEKRAFLSTLEAPVTISEAARAALEESDIIVFGSGTQHSSLLPSYKTRGVREAIQASQAKLKIFIANIHEDHDTRGLSVTDLVDRALYYLNDPQNQGAMITHILSPAENATADKVTANTLCDGTQYCSAQVVRRPIESPVRPGIHGGSQTAREIIELYTRRVSTSTRELQIFIDLNKRSLALPYLIQELLEVDWLNHVNRVEVVFRGVNVPPVQCPPYLALRTYVPPAPVDDTDGDMQVVEAWLNNSNSKYLATLTGDGEYRVRDIVHAMRVCEEQSFGAVYGSRTQSRRQTLASLEAAYSESRFLFLVSWLANFVLAFLYGFRFQVIFSDPLTGFRVYQRDALKGIVRSQGNSRPRSASYLTGLLLANNIEIAEIPVSYRTYRGFTSVRWRIKRGLRHVFSLFGGFEQTVSPPDGSGAALSRTGDHPA